MWIRLQVLSPKKMIFFFTNPFIISSNLFIMLNSKDHPPSVCSARIYFDGIWIKIPKIIIFYVKIGKPSFTCSDFDILELCDVMLRVVISILNDYNNNIHMLLCFYRKSQNCHFMIGLSERNTFTAFLRIYLTIKWSSYIHKRSQASNSYSNVSGL